MKKIIKTVTFLMLMTLSHELIAQDVCSSITSNKSTPESRQELLVETKAQLLSKANSSITSIQNAKYFLEKCNNPICREIEDNFMMTLREQMNISKILKVLSTVDYLYFEPLVKVEVDIKYNKIDMLNVLNFSQKGFSYTEKEMEYAFELWKQLFFHYYPNYEDWIHLPNGELQNKMNQFFEIANLELVNKNPLLPFVDESVFTDKKNLFKAFDKLIEFNKEFISLVDTYKTNHKTGFWSYVNLAVADHEMGLVNFDSLITEVIGSQPNKVKQEKFCRARNFLQSQQKIRIRASIGVGFTAAVVCGVGIWSGVGTVPAAALCSFAVADALWGARMGAKTSKLGYYSAYAGKILNLENLNFSEGVMSYIEAKQLEKSGHIVFLINVVGIVPIVRSTIAATKGAHGTIKSLLVVPSADVAGSTSEAASTNLVYVMLALRGLELNTDNLNKILAGL